jgi:hypothetical protein
MKVKVPTGILNEVISYIKIDGNISKSNEKQQQKFIKVLIELFMFIYDRQINDDEIFNLKGFTNINKKELKRFNIQIGKRYEYKSLINILSFIGLISINEKYSVGSFSKGYRVESEYIKTTNLTEVDIDIDKVFHNTYNKSYWLNKYPIQSNLIEDVYNSFIDLDSYIHWLNNNIGTNLKPIIKNGFVMERVLNEERAYHHLFLALKVNMKNIWFKLSDEGRFYSSISNLPFGSIPFLKLYGYDTVGLDVRNCQPLLLSILLNNEKYSSDTQNGIFYKEMAKELGKSENEFKVLSFQYIFFNPKPLKSGKLYNAMEKRYKGIMDQINNIKKEGCLAKKLQTIESDIFVKGLGPLNMFKLIRHDEVIVTLNNKDTMSKYLRKEFKMFNINIIIKYS